MATKVCRKCGKEKCVSQFHKVSAVKSGLSARCKECCLNYVRESRSLRKANKDYEIPKSKICSSCGLKKDIEEFSIDNSRKDRHQCNCKSCVSKYILNRRSNDNLFYASSRIRNLVLKSIQRMGYTKRSKTKEILGIDFNGFKNHIESKFSDGMNWDNRHLWHIDHIIPISSAKSEEEVIKLNHYTNLQPLWAEDNYRKGNKLNYKVK
jgi:hypothetical protein